MSEIYILFAVVSIPALVIILLIVGIISDTVHSLGYYKLRYIQTKKEIIELKKGVESNTTKRK